MIKYDSNDSNSRPKPWTPLYLRFSLTHSWWCIATTDVSSHILAIPDVVKAIVDFKDDPETQSGTSLGQKY